MSRSTPCLRNPITWRWSLPVVLLCASSAAYPAESTLDAQTLLGQVARTPPATIRYIEARFSRLLTSPLVVSGTLSYLGPRRFYRTVESPYREEATIRDGEVVVVREGQAPNRFALKRAPALAGMLDSFGALLSGDADLLSRSFDMTLSGDQKAWRIELAPRSPSIAKWLSSIVIDGADDVPRCITLIEPDGDRGVMLLGDLADQPLPDPLDPASLESRCTARGRN